MDHPGLPEYMRRSRREYHRRRYATDPDFRLKAKERQERRKLAIASDTTLLAQERERHRLNAQRSRNDKKTEHLAAHIETCVALACADGNAADQEATRASVKDLLGKQVVYQGKEASIAEHMLCGSKRRPSTLAGLAVYHVSKDGIGTLETAKGLFGLSISTLVNGLKLLRELEAAAPTPAKAPEFDAVIRVKQDRVAIPASDIMSVLDSVKNLLGPGSQAIDAGSVSCIAITPSPAS